MVLDVLVGPTLQNLGQFLPLVPVLPIHDEEYHLFLQAPLIILDVRVQVVVPALSALFWLFPRNLSSYLLPALWPLLFNQIGELCVLLDGPGALNVPD